MTGIDHSGARVVATTASGAGFEADRVGVFFAGEAAHPDHPATVHGAFLSGVRAAREIGGVPLG